MLNRNQQKLRDYVDLISRSIGGIEAVAESPINAPLAYVSGVESTASETSAGAVGQKAVDERLRAAAVEGVRKLAAGTELSHLEMAGVEAIIIPDKRPAFDIVDDSFRATHPLWMKLEEDQAIHDRLIAAIPRIGRIELLNQTGIPYGGTGFVVGDGLVMTNRHVAEIFARGPGDRQIAFSSSIRPGFSPRRERGRPPGPFLTVRRVRMIHPWWDMALLEVEGLPPSTGTMKLSVQDARAMSGHEVAIIGYPAYDPLRNDPDVQNKLFDRTYGVKRLQPGMLATPRQTESFAKLVDAATHDCSSLGGSSGSAVIDLSTGEVLALHFGGRYLDVNYAVPAAELARDGRVRDAGVQFAGAAPGGPPPAWLHAWDGIETPTDDHSGGGTGSPGSTSPPPPSSPPPAAPQPAAGRVTFELPLRITVELGSPMTAPSVAVETAPPGEAFTEAMREPEHDDNYSSRRGYDPRFLSNVTVPMPSVRDTSVLAPLKAGGTELRYQNFSIQMHAARRLALITASNITRKAQLRKPEPGRDYTRKGLSGLGPNDMEKWFVDRRLDERFQVPDYFYTRDDGAFDKGHLVRREDVAWGRTFATVQRANGDTYHVTNCSPQVAQFNQSARGEDNWGDLENLVMSGAAEEQLCVFAGPILDSADETFVGRAASGQALRLKIPSRFWKVIVARVQSGIASFGFVLEQDLTAIPLEFVVSENFRRLQVPLSQIEAVTGVDFGHEVRDADTFDSESGQEAAWRGGLIRTESLVTDTDAMRPTPNGGDDIAAETGSAPAPRVAAATEAPGQWRVARSLEKLRRQVNERWPQRNKASDGTIGDAAHATRDSDHNPWVVEDAFGVVTALDITHDPAHGVDSQALAEAIVASQDPRVKYVISNRRIANFAALDGAHPWAWRPYNGANPHNKHVHISVRPEKAAYDDETSWQI